MKKVITIVIVLAGLNLPNAQSQTMGWLRVSSQQIKSEIEQMFQMEQKALEQEIMQFQEANNWMEKSKYLDESSQLSDQELIRRFQVIRNEERMLMTQKNNGLDDWMFDTAFWGLEDDLAHVWEDTSLMADWMFARSYWEFCLQLENECIELEAWMLDVHYFATCLK